MFRSTGTFDRLMEKATSQLLLEPDWMSTMAICDSVRGGDTPPKYAVAAIKKKFYHENPHVQLYGLQVMESVVKNCGAPVHQEIATTQFMEEMRELVKQSNDEKVKGKVLELIQTWGTAFKGSQKYSIVTETLNLMKAEGWEFPPIRESGAMFEADVAPEWAEGTVCHRCRTEFGIVTRQHHCRACGQVFCGRCSSKSCVLPKFGIEKEVRVCDSCYEEHGPKGSSSATQGGSSSSGESSPVKSSRGGSGGNRRGHHRNPMGSADVGAMDSDLPAEYLSSPLSKEPQAPAAAKTTGEKSEAEIKEEEELQLALALSQSEAEESEKRRKKRENSQFYSSAVGKDNSETVKNSSTEKADGGELNPELMRYLQRDYWEQKEKTRADSSATIQQLPPTTQEALVMAPAATGVSGAKSAEELDEFVTTLRTQVEIFVNRMKSNSSRGRSIANDSSVQTLFMNAMSMHSQLLKHIQEQEDKRVYFEGLQDKLTQVKDARAALDALREEERERRCREAEEAERQRQIQMQQKLDLMRQKKQEYLQYQRQLALQRMQEQEREMQLRQEQAKQLYVQKPVPGTATGMAPQMGMMQPPPPQQHPMYPGYMPPQQQQTPPQVSPHQQQPYGYDPSMTVPPSYQPLPPQQQQQPMIPPPVEQSTSAPPTMAASGATSYNMQQMASALPPLGQTSGVPQTPASAHPIQAAPYAPQPPPPMAPNPHHMLPQQQHQHVPQDQQQMVGQQQQQPQPQAPVAPAVGAPTPQDSLISFD